MLLNDYNYKNYKKNYIYNHLSNKITIILNIFFIYIYLLLITS